MIQTSKADRIRFTNADLELFPDDGKRYEIIDGDLFVTHAPHWNHNKAVGRLYAALENWTFSEAGFGEATLGSGIIFSPEDDVISDAVWVADVHRLEHILDSGGHLTEAPDLAIESLSPGKNNERRDKILKLKLYSNWGVKEYWIVDWHSQTLEVYRRENAQLQRVATLYPGDTLTSPLLPGFDVSISLLFQRGKSRPSSQ
jgi:Uma2 family endonuclease